MLFAFTIVIVALSPMLIRLVPVLAELWKADWIAVSIVFAIPVLTPVAYLTSHILMKHSK